MPHADRTTPLPVSAPAPTRRAVLGTGAGLAAAALVTAPAAATPGGGLPASSTKGGTRGRPAADPRRIRFHAWRGAQLASGHHDGTRITRDGLVLARATGNRSYTDPYGDGTAVEYDEATWTSPVVRPGFGLTELIASWDATTPDGTWLEVLVRGTADDGTRTGWYVLGRWASDDPGDGGTLHRTSVGGQGTEHATVYVDTLATLGDHVLHDWQLQLRLLRRRGGHASPTVRFLGAVASNLPDAETVATSEPTGRARTLDVPTLSQELHKGHYPQWDNGGEAWCSPTSTAMVLGYWGAGPSAADLAWVDPPVDPQVDFAARNVFDYRYDGAGNWPFNTAYAARYGLEGFVTRLRSLTEAEAFIAKGIPLVASVSFEKEDMDGAGYGTNGHLLVICGFTADGNVVVNDPASHLLADNDEVRVTYRRDQFENAWVPHSGGTVYVIHPRSHRLPHAPREANW